LICPLISEIRYIGITKNKLEYRLNKHIREIDKSDTHKNNWLKLIRSNGLLDKLKIELIEECDLHELTKREIFWIDFYKKHNFKLTNSTIGGEGITGYKHTIEAKKKISERSKKPKKKVSDIARKNISKSLIGNKRRLGKKHSNETRKKISMSKKGSIACNKKSVYQYDKLLNFIAKYDSVKEAKIITGANNISSVCNGKRKYDIKCIWSYEKLD
jgi:hypothetical protein